MRSALNSVPSSYDSIIVFSEKLTCSEARGILVTVRAFFGWDEYGNLKKLCA